MKVCPQRHTLTARDLNVLETGGRLVYRRPPCFLGLEKWARPKNFHNDTEIRSACFFSQMITLKPYQGAHERPLLTWKADDLCVENE
ncbi:hypothetical protein SAMN05443507_1434 [Alicyclobacillus tolerans]|uniref:Uncharacterized protein n=1 Tax=Alicyclobacillus tolerans TaxID=90970 RepID=A0A1M6Y5S3_9BACL|nr:hypothetical protein SAMN05443507_1434 [Alicyclobacillus montanus]